MELKGSKTEKNLMEAFAGESQARNKYTYYASKAKKEGYNIIADKFEQTANNEKEHAKIWFKLLHGGEVPSTVENLKDAAAGENYEWTDMYDRMAREADEEGFTNRFPVQIGRRHRKRPRRKIQRSAEISGRRQNLQPPDQGYLGMRQLRPPRRKPDGTGKMPGLRPSAGLFL